MKIWRRLNYSVLAATIVLYLTAVVAMRKKIDGFPSHRIFLLTIAVGALFAMSNSFWRIAQHRSYKASKKIEVGSYGR